LQQSAFEEPVHVAGQVSQYRRYPGLQLETTVEHHFTETQEGSIAGAWWAPHAASPELAWMFDVGRKVLIVTTRTGARTERRIVGERSLCDEAGRKFLPGLALYISRQVTQRRS
jgi:hypothetical protein